MYVYGSIKNARDCMRNFTFSRLASALVYVCVKVNR